MSFEIIMKSGEKKSPRLKRGLGKREVGLIIIPAERFIRLFRRMEEMFQMMIDPG
jgi:hypothetical protein